MAVTFLKALSQLLGVIYLTCWSFCNVPQFILNWQRKSVQGFSITFQALNMVGFVNYFIFLVYGYHYQHSHHITESIVWQDFMWCASSLVFVYLTAIQVYIFRNTISESIHLFYRVSIFAILLLSAYNFLLAITNQLEWWSEADGFHAYSFMHFLGYSKTYISFIKYLPQVLLNFRMKNTRGFSIIAVLMDITGATTSFLQAFVNAYADAEEDGPNFQTIFGNLPKFLLSMESIFFCGILTFQHYVLYAEENERLRLLADLDGEKHEDKAFQQAGSGSGSGDDSPLDENLSLLVNTDRSSSDEISIG